MAVISYLGINGHAGFVMSNACARFHDEGHDITLHCADSHVLDDELERIPEFLEQVKKSDILFVNVHGDVTGFRHFENLLFTVKTSGVPMLLFGCEDAVVFQYRSYFKWSDEDYNLLRTFETIGGDDNHYATLCWVLRNVSG
ncbi:MAG: hypothetical protein MJZ21_05685, partial [archaeon]|nr:hypothetical protein [archaeon]